MTDVVRTSPRIRRRRPTVSVLLGRFGFYAALLILIAVFAVLSPAFLTFSNSINVLQQTSTIGIMALGETLVILAGGIDVSVGSVLGLGGMVAAIALRDAGAGPVTATVVGTCSGLVAGVLNGIVITRLRIDPFITTLAMLSAVRGTVYIISNQYNVDVPDRSSFLLLGRGHVGAIPISVVIFAVLLTSLRCARFSHPHDHIRNLRCRRRAVGRDHNLAGRARGPLPRDRV
jgi:ribose/xylose/arabinose/galactoside ABC-type transport system permease subunit